MISTRWKIARPERKDNSTVLCMGRYCIMHRRHCIMQGRILVKNRKSSYLEFGWELGEGMVVSKCQTWAPRRLRLVLGPPEHYFYTNPAIFTSISLPDTRVPTMSCSIQSCIYSNRIMHDCIQPKSQNWHISSSAGSWARRWLFLNSKVVFQDDCDRF